MNDLMTAWRSCFVRRWHSNPDMSDLHDENGAHQGRCAMLAIKLFPDCSRDLLVACVTHDAAEWFVGDLPYTRRDQSFAAALDEAEARAIEGMGLGLVLTAEDKRRLKFVDRLDAYLFAAHRRPHVLVGDGWPEHGEWLRREWQDTGAAGSWIGLRKDQQ